MELNVHIHLVQILLIVLSRVSVFSQEIIHQCVHNKEDFLTHKWETAAGDLKWAATASDLPEAFRERLVDQYEDVFYFDLSDPNTANPRIVNDFSWVTPGVPAYIYIKYYAHAPELADFYLMPAVEEFVHIFDSAVDFEWREELVEIDPFMSDPFSPVDIGADPGPVVGNYFFIDTIIFVHGREFSMNEVKELCPQDESDPPTTTIEQSTSTVGSTGTVTDSTQASTDSTQASTDSTQASTDSTQESTESSQASTDSTQASTDSTQASTESSQASTDSTQASTDSTQASTDSTQASTDSTQASTESTQASTDSSQASTDSTQESTESTQASTDSTQASTDSTQASTDSTQESTESTQASTDSSQASTDSTQESTESTQASTDSTQTSTDSTQESTDSTQASTDSTQESTESTQASTDSTQASTDSTQASTDSTQESTESTQASTDSSQASTDSTQASTDSSQASTYSTKVSTDSTEIVTDSTTFGSAFPGTQTFPTLPADSSPRVTDTSSVTPTSYNPIIDSPDELEWYYIAIYSLLPLIFLIVLAGAMYYYHRYRRQKQENTATNNINPITPSPSNLSLKSFDITVNDLPYNNNTYFPAEGQGISMKNPLATPNPYTLSPDYSPYGNQYSTLQLPDNYGRRGSNVSNRSARSTYSGVKDPDGIIPRLIRN